jgi:flagellar biosynthesis repressor protein FlbT
MPLRIDLKPGEKFIVNGAVIQNGNNPAQLLILNQSNILQQKDIILPNEVQTQEQTLYLVLQLAYLFPDNRAVHIEEFNVLRDIYVGQRPLAAPIFIDITRHLVNQDYYGAMKVMKRWIASLDTDEPQAITENAE